MKSNKTSKATLMALMAFRAEAKLASSIRRLARVRNMTMSNLMRQTMEQLVQKDDVCGR